MMAGRRAVSARGGSDPGGGRGDSGGRGSGSGGGRDESGSRGSGSDGSDGGRDDVGDRRSGGRGGARRVRRRDEENADCVQWDDEGNQILPLGEDADPHSHRMRGYSPGGFGIYPATPKVVRIADGCTGTREIDRKDPGFWHTCTEEFFRYYTFDSRYARASIHAHMRGNMRRTLADDKTRADDLIATVGGTYAEHRPAYVKPGVWSRLCEYWVSEEFVRKSIAGKAAREKVQAPHTSGARSFDRRRQDYMETYDGNLDNTVVYKDCHTYKDKERKGQWITKKAKYIIDHYIEICLKKDIDHKETHIHTWIKAVGGARKNMIMGHPQLRASDVIGSERTVPPRKGEGSSGRSSLVRIQDDLFLRVVDETLTQARADPENYMLTPKQVRVLAREAVEGYSSLPEDHPVMREARHAIIRVAVEVLNNLYKTDGLGAAKGKAIAEDDDAIDDGGGEYSSTDSKDRNMRHMSSDFISKGGPVIRG